MMEQQKQPQQKKKLNFIDNWKAIASNPYARLIFAYRLRILLVVLLIPYILYRGYYMVMNYQSSGWVGVVGRLIMIAVFAVITYKIYQTIPIAKKQIEYYKENPKRITYRPNANVKAEVNDILKMFEEKSINYKVTNKNRDNQSEKGIV